MKLGDKLKATLAELEQANIRRLEEQARADMEKIRKEREQDDRFVKEVFDHIVDRINAGRVPLYRVMDYNRQKWVREVKKGSGRNYDLWKNMVEYLRKERLGIVTAEGHDGMGMESWIEISVEVLPDRPRAVSFNDGPNGEWVDPEGVGQYRG